LSREEINHRNVLNMGKTFITNAPEKLIELERQFERVHMKVSVDIKEPSLRDLFHKLSAGDQNHVAVLDRIIRNLP
jgi:hypothetical protein